MKKLTHFTKKEVDQFFSSARTVLKCPELTILFAPRGKEYARLLIVASRKVGNAPQRNKLKRRLKAIFYENNLFENVYDYAIILRKEAAWLSFTELQNLILQAIKNHAQ